MDNLNKFKIIQSSTFEKWYVKLKDPIAKLAIFERIARLENGIFGDCLPVGESVFELRMHFGPGYRVYFYQCKEFVVVLLCAGNKSTQKIDIKKAKQILKKFNE